MTDTTRLTDLKARYTARHPRSQQFLAQAAQWMPGGNTRTVLHFDPFPMVIERGVAERFVDIDGHEYIDCAGEFSAGLYGHSDPNIMAALREALENGLVLSGPNRHEAALAELACTRFASIEQVRFCNSGTEANLYALITAQNATGRSKILAFDGAYHGGVLTFPTGAGAGKMNVPFDVVISPYNDPEAAMQQIAQHADALAAIIVEPLLGAAGNILATQDFLQALREASTQTGALLIFDEVKTSRLGAAGLQGHFGITPDMTTLGKYLGGGLPIGAFGGRRDIMARFDPTSAHPLGHAGTFNNNVLSMAAGAAGLSQVFTPERAEDFLARTEEFRSRMNDAFRARGLGVVLSGMGSILSLHLGQTPPRTCAEINAQTSSLRKNVHLHALEKGLALTPRGDIFLSLPMSDQTLSEVQTILLDVVAAELPSFQLGTG